MSQERMGATWHAVVGRSTLRHFLLLRSHRRSSPAWTPRLDRPLLLLLLAALAACLLADVADAGRKDVPRRSLQEAPSSPGPALPPLTFWILIGVSALVLLLGVVAGIVLLCRWRKGPAPPPSPRPRPGAGGPRGLRPQPPGVPAGLSFSVEEMKAMTKQWDPASVIEDGGHSTVYLGLTDKGKKVAIKRAKIILPNSAQMFHKEVNFLSVVKHPNVVKFKGSCDKNKEQILVFEYIPGGNLSSWLRPGPPVPGQEGPQRPLGLMERLLIAIDVAEALNYMHSFSKPTIIHRDIKSDTILLDSSCRAHVGGLGLLKHLPGEALRARMERRRGYMDPEYLRNTKMVTTKCDVFALGVVLLELVTGKPPVIEPEEGGGSEGGMPLETTSLVQWALPAINGEDLESIVDPRLPRSGHNLEVLKAIALVAAACVAPLRTDRPDMPQVLELLKAIKETD